MLGRNRKELATRKQRKMSLVSSRQRVTLDEEEPHMNLVGNLTLMRMTGVICGNDVPIAIEEKCHIKIRLYSVISI